MFGVDISSPAAEPSIEPKNRSGERLHHCFFSRFPAVGRVVINPSVGDRPSSNNEAELIKMAFIPRLKLPAGTSNTPNTALHAAAKAAAQAQRSPTRCQSRPSCIAALDVNVS